MSDWDTSLPFPLNELHKLEFGDADGSGIDFEPFEVFLSSERTARWFKAWTGNAEVSGREFRVFGQDGSGGYAAFWLVHLNENILEQPIVFLGSEGERGVVATTFSDYLWLLAGGLGPYEAVAYPKSERPPNSSFTRFAQEHSLIGRRPTAEIVEKANGTYPNFHSWIESMCR